MKSIASQFHSGCSLSHFQLEYIHYKIWNRSNSNQYLISKWSRFFSKAIIWRVQKCYVSHKISNWERGSKLSLWLPTVVFHETATLEIAFPGTVLYLATGNAAPASDGTESERRILHTHLSLSQPRDSLVALSGIRCTKELKNMCKQIHTSCLPRGSFTLWATTFPLQPKLG